MKRLDLATGAAITICEVPAGHRNHGHVESDGSCSSRRLKDRDLSSTIAGGAPVAEVKVDRRRMRCAWRSLILPDGRRYLYVSNTATAATR
jgi:hypothetical protein